MMSLLKTLKDPRTIAVLLSAHALGLAIATLYFVKSNEPQRIATADMQSIMDAQKLVWVQKMRAGEKDQVIASSRAFQQKLEGILAEITVQTNTVIIDKNALVAGSEVQDMTPVIMERLGLSMSEAQKMRETLEEELFSDFPTMRKGR